MARARESAVGNHLEFPRGQLRLLGRGRSTTPSRCFQPIKVLGNQGIFHLDPYPWVFPVSVSAIYFVNSQASLLFIHCLSCPTTRNGYYVWSPDADSPEARAASRQEENNPAWCLISCRCRGWCSRSHLHCPYYSTLAFLLLQLTRFRAPVPI